LFTACLVNPYGLEGLLFPFKLFGRLDPSAANIFSRNISENLPLLDLWTTQSRYVWAVLVTTAALVASFVVNYKQVRWAHILLCACFAFLAFRAQRNILLYFVVCAPVLGYNLSSAEAGKAYQQLPGRARMLLAAAATIAVTSILTLDVLSLCRIISLYPSHSCISPFSVPQGAVRYLDKYAPSGNIFNADRDGGYLIWKWYPPKQVFIDDRLIIRPPQFFGTYLALLDNPELFTATAARFNITHVLLPTAIHYRYMRLVRWLYHSGSWRLVFADGTSALFFRNDIDKGDKVDLSTAEGQGRVLAEIGAQWPHDPAIHAEAEGYFANLLHFLGEKRR
jgi:hypothetical protein